ncbi:MAG TPA: MBL fold metallo-hydrolase [Planctomycetota bacterium]|nr:MBL fold metallo-hydrolase [Planctomycetota bacterium]
MARLPLFPISKRRIALTRVLSRITAAFALFLGACNAPHLAVSEPYVVVLGTAQDGGLPQIGCTEELCVRARADVGRKRLSSSLLLADPRSGKRWLFDASPDLREQVERARLHPPTRREDGARPPLFDGVFLTHAHVGHYAGLLQFGREIYAARDLPVWGTARMREFLSSNGPWSLLVESQAITLVDMPQSGEVELAPDLFVSALRVPHRDEFSDTLAYVIRGPHATIAYLPDIDKWERWSVRLEDLLARVDVALLDGTFFADGEIHGRPMSDIPHPFMTETLERLSDAPGALRSKVVFTHLNHTNPASTPGSKADRRVRDAGMRVACEGEIIAL